MSDHHIIPHSHLAITVLENEKFFYTREEPEEKQKLTHDFFCEKKKTLIWAISHHCDTFLTGEVNIQVSATDATFQNCSFPAGLNLHPYNYPHI